MHRHPANVARHDQRSLGDRIADGASTKIGSWGFIIGQAVFTAAWLISNSLHGWSHWDSYPFVLLNLVYSFQAGFTGPVLLLANNRQSEHDRVRAEHDYTTNAQALALLRHIAQQQGVTETEVQAILEAVKAE